LSCPLQDLLDPHRCSSVTGASAPAHPAVRPFESTPERTPATSRLAVATTAHDHVLERGGRTGFARGEPSPWRYRRRRQVPSWHGAIRRAPVTVGAFCRRRRRKKPVPPRGSVTACRDGGRPCVRVEDRDDGSCCRARDIGGQPALPSGGSPSRPPVSGGRIQGRADRRPTRSRVQPSGVAPPPPSTSTGVLVRPR
jgi:hypothetical protein